MKKSVNQKGKQKIYYGIGGMSGTSLDGVDLSYCRYYTQPDGKWQFELIDAQTYPYPEKLKAEIEHLIKNYNDNHTDLDKRLGAFYSSLIQQFVDEFNIEKIDFVANHGQTVYHNPTEQKTVQIGCGETMAQQIQLRIINNFRINDAALGGQGAPLVPIGDWHFFNTYRYCINLGGICNITVQNSKEVLTAFDISPCNVLLNHYAQQLNVAFDKDGLLARKGNLNKALFEKLNTLPYYSSKAPKSLDAQFSKADCIPLIDTFNLSTEDVLHTLCHHYAYQIGLVIETYSQSEVEQMLLSGGGAFNGFLTDLIQEKCKVKVHIPDKKIIEFKEAIVFGLLGVLKLENEVNCLQVVTGAGKDNVGGVVFDI